MKRGHGRKKKKVNFLSKTYCLVETGPSRLIDWQADGLSFVVKKPKEFEVYAREHGFFKGKFSSFVRQLNFYGFHKIVADLPERHIRGREKEWAFRHENFVRGRPELLEDIVRASGSVRASDSVSPPETEVQSSPMHVAGSAAAPSTVPVAAISSASLELQELRGDVMALRSMAGQMTAALGRIVHLMHKRGVLPIGENSFPTNDGGGNGKKAEELLMRSEQCGNTETGVDSRQWQSCGVRVEVKPDEEAVHPVVEKEVPRIRVSEESGGLPFEFGSSSPLSHCRSPLSPSSPVEWVSMLTEALQHTPPVSPHLAPESPRIREDHESNNKMCAPFDDDPAIPSTEHVDLIKVGANFITSASCDHVGGKILGDSASQLCVDRGDDYRVQPTSGLLSTTPALSPLGEPSKADAVAAASTIATWRDACTIGPTVTTAPSAVEFRRQPAGVKPIRFNSSENNVNKCSDQACIDVEGHISPSEKTKVSPSPLSPMRKRSLSWTMLSNSQPLHSAVHVTPLLPTSEYSSAPNSAPHPSSIGIRAAPVGTAEAVLSAQRVLILSTQSERSKRKRRRSSSNHYGTTKSNGCAPTPMPFLSLPAARAPSPSRAHFSMSHCLPRERLPVSADLLATEAACFNKFSCESLCKASPSSLEFNV